MSRVAEKLSRLASVDSEQTELPLHTPHLRIARPPLHKKKSRQKPSILGIVLVALAAMGAGFWHGLSARAEQHATDLAPSKPNVAQLLLDRRYAEAEVLLNEILTSDSQNVDAMVNLAFVLKQKSDFASAERLLKAALELNPNHAIALNNLGRVYAAQGQWDHAVASYKSALTIEANYADAVMNLAAAYEALEEWGFAVAAYENFLQLNDKNFAVNKTIQTRLRRLRSLQTFSLNRKGEM